MKKGLLLSFSVVSFIVGALLGGFYIHLQASTPISEEAESIVQKYPQAEFTSCEDGNVHNPQCVQKRLLEYAILSEDEQACDDLSGQDKRQNCEERVNRFKALQNPEQFCHGVNGEELCGNLSRLLLAVESGDVQNCDDISQAPLVQSCIQLSPENPIPAQEEQTSENPFSLNCTQQDQQCQQNQVAYANAVQQLDVSVCDEFNERLAQRCRHDVAFYPIYEGGEISACEQHPFPEECRVDFRVSEALSNRDSSLCADIAGQRQQYCEDIVQTFNGTRFGYLEEFAS